MEKIEKENLDISEVVVNIGAKVTTGHIRMNNLIQLLIDKGVITEEELEQLFEETYDSESKKIHDFILTGEIGV
ncbi:hypothetical protein [Psychrobacillus antarcticus]|uniref:hypothetical protein n=1 Tax=Psychrobacillus antarcticus TaxID=2879115 RepID=UPI00240888F7|nr:hypothetical protein [Psychrobacillus antarcticus]